MDGDSLRSICCTAAKILGNIPGCNYESSDTKRGAMLQPGDAAYFRGKTYSFVNLLPHDLAQAGLRLNQQ